MNFEFDDRFIKALSDIESFIALDSLERAENSKMTLLIKLALLILCLNAAAKAR